MPESRSEAPGSWRHRCQEAGSTGALDDAQSVRRAIPSRAGLLVLRRLRKYVQEPDVAAEPDDALDVLRARLNANSGAA